MSKRTYGCLLAIAAVPIAVIVLFIGTVAWQLFQHTAIRESVAFSVPGTSLSSTFENRHSPHDGKDDRDIAFVIDGKKTRAFPLMIDTCGGYPINYPDRNAQRDGIVP